MCILFVELCDDPAPGGFRLILASNRDENYRRPTDHAAPWQEAPAVFGGRDQEPGREGGTWLALDTEGCRLAVLLNVLGTPSNPDMRPRGSLVADFVRGREHARDYVHALARDGPEYSAFHIVAIDLNPSPSAGGMWHYCNSAGEGGAPAVSHWRAGRLGLGNSLVEQPFLKVTAGRQRFDAILDRGRGACQRDQIVADLVSLLKWEHEHFPDETLRERAAKSCIAEASLRKYSSIFQRHAGYGTRTHTIILVDAEWRCDYYEWTLGESLEAVDPDKSAWHLVHKIFRLTPAASEK